MATWQMVWDDGDTGSSFITSFPKLTCNQSAGHAMKPHFSQDMGLSHRISKVSTLPKPHSVLVGNWHTNPLCHGLPPHNLLPCGTTQPIWFRSVASNSTSRRKIHNFLHLLQNETSLFRPDPI
ncbi:hypothetical protein AVEN_228732-1 [Araneus ventricosus]|uniref:Uncharacterized protein n=1 Tax=Araneus ventricosus TaxID=182803 RepID=A0A4Y2UPD4_ARAVE|nr:hypothetical protein AVEN_228732-1 [Araneus ventricosus]